MLRRPSSFAVAVLATLLPTLAAAQDSTAARTTPRDTARKWHFSIAGGLSAPQRPTWNGGTRMSNGEFLRGARQGGAYFSLGASRRMAGTALELRNELYYNRLGTSANAMYFQSRAALRDESFGLATSLVWRARPQGRFTPYLVTGIDNQYVRLGANPTLGDARITERYGDYNLGATYGAGLQLPVGRHTMLLELRRFDTLIGNVRGSDFTTVTIGWRF